VVGLLRRFETVAWIASASAGVLLSVSGCGVAAETAEVSEERARARPTPPTTSSRVADAVAAAPSLENMPAQRLKSADSVGPSFPIEAPEEFDAVAFGSVVEFVPGPGFLLVPDEPNPSNSVVMEFKVLQPVAGDVTPGESLFVRLVTEDLAGLRASLPPGTLSVVAVSLVDESDDKHLDDPGAGVPPGAQRFIAGFAYAGFADGPRHTWFPLLQEVHPRPLNTLLPRSEVVGTPSRRPGHGFPRGTIRSTLPRRCLLGGRHVSFGVDAR
jgi:hypothetical protein